MTSLEETLAFLRFVSRIPEGPVSIEFLDELVEEERAADRHALPPEEERS